MIFEMILQILALFVAMGTFLPLLRSDTWLIRIWDFPRLQLFCLGVPVLIALFFFSFNDDEIIRDWVIIGFLGLALLSLAWWIHRYTPIHKKELQDGTGEVTIRFLVSNVLMYNREHGRLIKHIKDYQPDIFVGLETDAWWTSKLSAISEQLPHSIELPQEDTYGMVMRSRIPLKDPMVEYIIRENIPSIHTAFELSDGSTVQLHALHPKPPFPDEDTSSTDRDAELLIVGKRVGELGGPSVVLGDMNDVAWSRTTKLFQKTSGLLDLRIGRGFFNTFHAKYLFARWPLDHIFVSDHFRLRKVERLSNVGSDHFPIFVEFSYEPELDGDQEVPKQTKGESEETEEKIRAAEDPAQIAQRV